MFNKNLKYTMALIYNTTASDLVFFLFSDDFALYFAFYVI